VLDPMFQHQIAWEHPTLMCLLEGLTIEQALWQPGPERRCIWQIVRHMLRWRTMVKDRLRGQETPNVDEEWPALPDTEDHAELARLWSRDVERMRVVHAQLAAAVKSMHPAKRHPYPALAHLPNWMAPLGVQLQDSYRLGQIALLRGLQGLPPVE
jgi:hypothetical protein